VNPRSCPFLPKRSRLLGASTSGLDGLVPHTPFLMRFGPEAYIAEYPRQATPWRVAAPKACQLNDRNLKRYCPVSRNYVTRSIGLTPLPMSMSSPTVRATPRDALRGVALSFVSMRPLTASDRAASCS
jgi:hypothetical protein